MTHETAMLEEIAHRLKSLRIALGYKTKRSFAEAHGWNETQYHNWEKAQRRIPIEAAEDICNRYALTLDWIYRGKIDGLSHTSLKFVSGK